MPNNVRVNIPEKTQDLMTLMQQVIDKHLKDGENSPLKSINMAEFIDKVKLAAEKDKETRELQKASTKATEARNLALGIDIAQSSATEGTAYYFLKSCRDVLLGIHKGREYSLGDWGFEVNTSQKTSKPDKPQPGATQV